MSKMRCSNAMNCTTLVQGRFYCWLDAVHLDLKFGDYRRVFIYFQEVACAQSRPSAYPIFVKVLVKVL